MAFILSAAVPCPPLMMAPHVPCAGPEARSAGDEADDRLFHVRFDKRRRGLFSRAADLADHHDGLGSGSSLKRRSASMCVVPMMGSPPMPGLSIGRYRAG